VATLLEQGEAAYGAWTRAVTSGHGPGPVVELYAQDAVLLPTLKTGPLQGRQGIREYFEHFTSLPELAMSTQTLLVREVGGALVASGLYTFTYADGDGQKAVPARFSFVFALHDGRWLIKDHHSSMAP